MANLLNTVITGKSSSGDNLLTVKTSGGNEKFIINNGGNTTITGTLTIDAYNTILSKDFSTGVSLASLLFIMDEDNDETQTLPDHAKLTATTDTLGHVIVGGNINVEGGVISVDTADSEGTLGLVKKGTNVSINDGEISVATASVTTADLKEGTLGLVKPSGANFSIDSNSGALLTNVITINEHQNSANINNTKVSNGGTINLGLGSGNSPTFSGLTLNGPLKTNGNFSMYNGSIEDANKTLSINKSNGDIETTGTLKTYGGINITNVTTNEEGEITETTKFTVDSLGNVETAGTLKTYNGISIEGDITAIDENTKKTYIAVADKIVKDNKGNDEYIGKEIHISSGVWSQSSDTGSLIIDGKGGLGVGGDISVGGNIAVGGAICIEGITFLKDDITIYSLDADDETSASVFSVDSTTGNTTIAGLLKADGDISISSFDNIISSDNNKTLEAELRSIESNLNSNLNTHSATPATTSTLGHVQPNDANFSIDANGILSTKSITILGHQGTDNTANNGDNNTINLGLGSDHSPEFNGLTLKALLSANGGIKVINASDNKEKFKVDTSGNVTANTFNATSDIRKKKNITVYEPKNSILDLEVKEFDYKDSDIHAVGCIAQELQEIFPEFVNKDEDGYLSIQEMKLIYPLLLEVKKLRMELDELKSRLEE